VNVRSLLIASLALLSACARKDAPSVQATEGGVTPIASAAPARKAPSTTSSAIALGNLGAEIDDRLKKDDKKPEARLALVEHLLARAQVLATVKDMDKCAFRPT